MYQYCVDFTVRDEDVRDELLSYSESRLDTLCLEELDNGTHFVAIMDEDIYDEFSIVHGVEVEKCYKLSQYKLGTVDVDPMDTVKQKRYEMMENIYLQLGTRTTLEQLAEEASELSQAALKAIRAHKLNLNPTPVTEAEATAAVLEEYLDILMCMSLIWPPEDMVILAQTIQNNPKWDRWKERLSQEPQEKHSAK